MLRFAAFTCVVLIVLADLTTSAADADIRLTGIVSLPGLKQALLQDSKHPGDYLLGEGERERDMEVTAISPADLTVTLNLHTNRNLKLSIEGATNEVSGQPPTILFQKASIHPVILIFQQLCNCTLLQHPQTPDFPFTFLSTATNPIDALHDFQNAFTNKGIVLIPDGDKFVIMGPTSAASMLIPRSAQASSAETSPSAQSTNAEIHAQDLLPGGVLDFRGADFNQVFNLYAMLIGRNIDRTHRFQVPVHGDFFIHTQTPVSKTEAVYAIGTLINWRGVNVVTQSDGSITALRAAR
jgi:hypothetical protein